MTVKFLAHDTLPVCEIEVTGKVTQADMDSVLPQMEAFIARHGTIGLVEVVRRFEGFEWSTVWDGVKFDVAHIRDLDRVAVVMDHGWVGGLARALAKVARFDMRVFPLSELEMARSWVGLR